MASESDNAVSNHLARYLLVDDTQAKLGQNAAQTITFQFPVIQVLPDFNHPLFALR